MSERTLVIGNYNYSTWSMRPWLLIKAFYIPCEVIVESLCGADLSERLRRHSPSARVPVLKDGVIDVWDSLAICEYLSEHYLDGKGWPADKTARAFARSVSAEMHSGFSALRGEMPMNIRARRRIEPSDACLRDIDRVTEIWETGRRNFAHQGNFLAGTFSIADCLFCTGGHALCHLRRATDRPCGAIPKIDSESSRGASLGRAGAGGNRSRYRG